MKIKFKKWWEGLNPFLEDLFMMNLLQFKDKFRTYFWKSSYLVCKTKRADNTLL